MPHNHQPKDEELMDPKLFGIRTHLGSLTHCSYQGNPLLEVLNGICMPGGCYPLVQGERKLLLLLSCSSEPDTPNPASEKTQAARAQAHQDAKHLGTCDEQKPLSCVAPDILVSGITR